MPSTPREAVALRTLFEILQQREPKYRKTERDAKSMKSKAKNPLATRYYEAAKKFKPPSWSLWGGHLRKKSTTKD